MNTFEGLYLVKQKIQQGSVKSIRISKDGKFGRYVN